MNYPNLEDRTVALDVEATGLSWITDKLFSFAIAFRDGANIQKHYFDIRRDPRALEWARGAFRKVRVVFGHYFKYDMHMCREAGIYLPADRVDCTMIREFLIDENKYTYGLDDLSTKYLDRKKVDVWPELAAMFGGKADKETQAANLWRAPPELVSKYAVIDAELALLIYEKEQFILDAEGLSKVHALERRLLPVIVDMERGGVPVDSKAAKLASRQMSQLIDAEQKQLDALAGGPLNVNSGPQTKKLLGVHQGEDGHWYTADKLKLEKTEKGAASLDSTRLHQCSLPAAKLIASLRGNIKARDVFLDTYILKYSHKGLIHASINQTRTEDGNGIYTGRLSISDPALQQIHKRNKQMAAIVRACFIPDWGDEWLCLDWSQMDFRIFAHFLNDKHINEEYAKDANMDFHSLVSQLTSLPRDRDQYTGGANAKQINLACVFGMGPGELAKQCGLPYTVHPQGYLLPGPQAKEMFAKYHNAIPGVKELQKNVEAAAKSRGFVRTMLGRRLRFPQGRNAHKAAGLLYQATAADAMKLKMVELHALLDGVLDVSARLMVTVHDEFNVSMGPYGFKVGMDKEIKALLERFDGDRTPMQFRIPIISDPGVGKNWHEASKSGALSESVTLMRAKK